MSLEAIASQIGEAKSLAERATVDAAAARSTAMSTQRQFLDLETEQKRLYAEQQAWNRDHETDALGAARAANRAFEKLKEVQQELKEVLATQAVRNFSIRLLAFSTTLTLAIAFFNLGSARGWF